MNKIIVTKKIISKILIYLSVFLFAFSMFLIFLAYNISSLKTAILSKPNINYITFEQFKANNPEFCSLASLEVKLPDLPLPIISGSTFETHINNIRSQKKTDNFSYNYSIVSAIDTKKEITDETYIKTFFDINQAFSKEIVTSYEKPFTTNNSENIDMLNVESEEQYFKKYWLNNIINNFCILKTAKYALKNKDYNMALKSDIAYLRYTRAAVSFGTPRLSNIINYDLYGEFLLSSDIFLETNAYFDNEELKRNFREALLKRIEFIKTQPDFALAFKNTALLLKERKSKLKLKDKLTLYTLNLWYGDPDEPFFKISNSIYAKKDSGYCEFKKILSEAQMEYPFKRNFTYEFAYTGDDIISILKFIRFAINTHPLQNNVYIPEYELDHFINLNIKLRMITLGGFMRLFYAQNKRWPDLNKDKEFTRQADICAINPNDNKLFEIIKDTDETFIIITSKVKDWYDPSIKNTENIKIGFGRP